MGAFGRRREGVGLSLQTLDYSPPEIELFLHHSSISTFIRYTGGNFIPDKVVVTNGSIRFQTILYLGGQSLYIMGS